MTQRYVVPNIYQDISNQSQGYFAFRFSCQECYWSVDIMPLLPKLFYNAGNDSPFLS